MLQEKLENLLQAVHAALESKEAGRVLELIEDIHPADVATIFSLLDEEEQSQLIYMLPARVAAEVVNALDEADRAEIVDELSQSALTEMVSELAPDDAADWLGELSESQRDDVLGQIPQDQAGQIEELLEYEEDSAGGIMNPELLALPESATVGEAIREVRKAAEDEEIHYVYVVDGEGKLQGLVPLRRLVTNRKDTPLKEISERDFRSVTVADDQEHVVNIIRRYDISAVPVVDEDGYLVGRITHDDILDVADEEADEDIYFMAGTEPTELEEASIFRAAFIRLRWLLACLFGMTISGLIMILFGHPFPEHLYMALVAFVPMMGAMGGNSGIQISTIIVRSLATGDLASLKIGKTFAREGRIALVMAPICGVVAGTICRFGVPILQHYGQIDEIVQPNRIATTVALGMTTAILTAAVLGITLPHLFRKVGVDPAIASGPIVTTANDVVSVSVFFSVAMLVAR